MLKMHIHKKNRFFFVCFTILAFYFSFGNFGHASENSLFYFTHLLPSPFTLPAGKMILGTVTGVGVTDFIEIQTNLLANFYSNYNVKLLASLLDAPTYAVSLILGFSYMHLPPVITGGAWLPGCVIGVEVIPNVAVFLGGNLFFSKNLSLNKNTPLSGYFQGGNLEADLSWAYAQNSGEIGNVLSCGLSYDFSFQFYGLGLSHHWKGFHFGMHYYPQVQTNRFQPIVSGQAVVDL